MGQEAAVFSGPVFRLFRACAGQETEIGISSGARGSTNRPCELDLPPLIGLLLFICSHSIILHPRALALLAAYVDAKASLLRSHLSPFSACLKHSELQATGQVFALII